MKKTKTIVLILIALITLAIIFPLTINAVQVNPENYEPSNLNTADVERLYQFGGSIAGVVQIIGTIVSAGALIIIGIRYILASVEEKAEYKERMIPYVIGVVMLFGTTNIVGIIDKIVGNNTEIITVTGSQDYDQNEHTNHKPYIYDCQSIYCLECRKKCLATRSTAASVPYFDTFTCNECGTTYEGIRYENAEEEEKLYSYLNEEEGLYGMCPRCGYYYDYVKVTADYEWFGYCYFCGFYGETRNEVAPGEFYGRHEDFFICKSCGHESVKDRVGDNKYYCFVCGSGPYYDGVENNAKEGNAGNNGGSDYTGSENSTGSENGKYSSDDNINTVQDYKESEFTYSSKFFNCPNSGCGATSKTHIDENTFTCDKCKEKYTVYKHSELNNPSDLPSNYEICYGCGYYYDYNKAINGSSCYNCNGIYYPFDLSDGNILPRYFTCPYCNIEVAKKWISADTYNCPICEATGFKD